MSQCQATYFDGGAAVSCQNYEGHDGEHTDVLGHWNIRVPLYERRDAIVRAARAVAEDARDQGRDDCMDDLVDEQLIEELRNALAGRPSQRQGSGEP